ncbi:MAG: hypothetical protein ACR2JM_09995 [Mycobacterium sp.]
MAGQDEGIPEWPFEDFGEPDWDDYPVTTLPVPPERPWYRSPRLLLVLIVAAAAALVVAAALLVTGNFSGEIPTGPGRLHTVTATSASPSSTASPTTTSASSTTPSSSTSTEPATSPPESAATEEPPLEAPGGPGGEDRSEGPRINVTRSPMSFTPGQSAGR